MHDIEPFPNWRERYVASEDERSPFFGREYDEFMFTKKIYNYFIHPQWDEFGSQTLYMKILYVDYEDGYAFIELIGEWNDCITNDIMFIKREVVDYLLPQGIYKYVLLCENVLNFHGADDSYYEEWYDDVCEEQGWICLVNTHDHVLGEIEAHRLQYYVHVGGSFNQLTWQKYNPRSFYQYIDTLILNRQKQLAD